VIQHRPATSVDDLRLAGEVMSRAWRSGSRTVVATPAGIEWWYASSWPEALADHLRLWTDGGDLVAWTWHDAGEIEWFVWTGQPARDVAVLEAILEDAIAASPGAIGIWTAEDDDLTFATLRHHGFEPLGRRLSQWQWHPADGEIAIPDVPTGYTIRHVAGPAEAEARVDVHRAAFAPSRLTLDKYERLATCPHYRFEDDLVVEAPDGTFAAFALAWWDPVGQVGEFEPVGTHPDHQRRGLARALLRHGMRRFADLGARTVQVYSDATDGGPEALYAAVGFRRRAYHQHVQRPAPGAAAVRSDA
jgi:mycothiol synthase